MGKASGSTLFLSVDYDVGDFDRRVSGGCEGRLWGVRWDGRTFRKDRHNLPVARRRK